jgi:acyl-CoA synthetase (AMP-forming)/AMP-acid ligase II
MINSSTLKLRVPEWPYASRNLIDVARRYADIAPVGLPFTFIDYSGTQPVDRALSYIDLDRRSRQIAALLQTRGRPGDRVLLLYAAGLDYVCAFFGCLYAGMIAVPAYPPLNPRLHSRLASMALDCQASVALTTQSAMSTLGERAQMPAPLAGLRWIATDEALDAFESAWREPTVDKNQVAFLQYTSGSTGIPKGVMVTHGNLLHNLYAMALHLQVTRDDRHLTWLPPYHDLGLIGGILGSFAAGVPLGLMTPASFLRRPERWLREISSRRCSVSGAPNFAYELCIDKVSDDDLATLDLSCWTLAFTGAEPVRADTLTRFSKRFAASGFQRRSFYPCYGMAETTLFVTCKPREEAPSSVTVDASQYANDAVATVVAPASDVPTVEIVSCGMPASGLDVLVVDPASLCPLPEGAIGEIVVSGPSVTAGYWQREAETSATFGNHIEGRPGAFLRTGDLGFMSAGHLYVSGRLKDVIIIRGVNHYPQDIEGTVDQCHEAIRAGCGIAFSVTSEENTERLVFVQEVGRREAARASEVFSAIRDAIVERHDIQPFAIALIHTGTIPKTTSGKLSRRPCREDFLAQRLALIAQWTNPLFAESRGPQPARVSAAPLF